MNSDETAPIYTQQQLEEHIRIVYEAEASTRAEILADAFALRFRRGMALLLLGGLIGYLIGQP
jgi:hypothetical protein